MGNCCCLETQNYIWKCFFDRKRGHKHSDYVIRYNNENIFKEENLYKGMLPEEREKYAYLNRYNLR